MPNIARLAIVTTLLLACLFWPRIGASQEGPALDCRPGARHILAGNGAPPAVGLLLTFDTRAIGGGVSDSAGRWSIPLTVGNERPGDYGVAVAVRGGAQLASWRCSVPDPQGPQPTQSTPIPVSTVAPLPTARVTATVRPTINPDPSICDPSYPDFCIAPPPPKLNCEDVPGQNFAVIGNDPHDFDGNENGVGCEE